MATQEIQEKRNGRGRPRREKEVIKMSVRIETDIHEWLMANKPEKCPLNKFINDIIRKEAGL